MSMEAVKEMLSYACYPAYSQSEVPWLEKVPTGWSVRQLRHVCEMLVSTIDKHSLATEIPVRLCNYVDVYKNSRITEDLDFMRATATAVEVARFRIRKGDVIITKDSEDWKDIAVPALVDHEAEDLVCGYHLAMLRPSGEIVPSFLYYSLLADYARTHLSLKAKGFTRFGIAHGGIRSTPLLLPPLPEQTRIAAFLDRKCRQIDAAIAQKERLITLLKERRQVLVQQAVTKGLDPQVKMKDSGVPWLGEVPEHWEVRRLGTLGAFGKGRELARGMTVPNGSPVILYGDLYTSFDVWTEQVVSFVGPDHAHMGTPITKGDLVLAASGETREDIGKCAAYMGDNEPRLGGDALRLSLKEGDSLYMSFLLNSPGVVAEKVKLCKGEIIVHIYPSMLKRIFLPVPPLEEQRAIGRRLRGKVEQERHAIKAALDQIAKLKEYRSILINSAVTGKIKVPEE